MARVYSFSKSGILIKATVFDNVTGVTQNYYKSRSAINLVYEPVGNTVNIVTGDINEDGGVAIANLTIAGTAITSQAVFDTQVASLFAELGAASNSDVTVSTLTAAAASGSSSDQLNQGSRGISIGINITVMGGTVPTLQVNIEGKDAASGVYYLLLASANLAVGFTNLVIYPGTTNTTNAVASKPLPRTWRVSYVVGGTAPAITATIGASLIV